MMPPRIQPAETRCLGSITTYLIGPRRASNQGHRGSVYDRPDRVSCRSGSLAASITGSGGDPAPFQVAVPRIPENQPQSGRQRVDLMVAATKIVHVPWGILMRDTAKASTSRA